MNSITLKQLRYVDALATHRHFGRAAEACAVSQPALSMQIKEMEGALGIDIFERSARQVQLTSFGEDFVGRVRTILRSVDELEDLADAARQGFPGRLRLGVIPTVAPYLLPGILGGLAQAHEGLDVQVRETVTPRLVQGLEAGQLDMAIVALPLSEPGLSQFVLFEEAFVLVRPASDEGKPVPAPQALLEMKLLLLEEGHCFRDQALSFCSLGSEMPAPRRSLDGSSLSTLVQMVGAGIGVTLIPEMAVPVETRSAPVSLARFSSPQPTRTIGIVWRKANPLAGQLAEIAGIVRESVSG
jgi:LysR family hydrogen peroxide-inducible transcriptional activator